MAERLVTVSVSYPVAPGEEEEFEAWSRLRLAESADRPGYLGGQVLAPPNPGPDWYIVHQFENERAASSWEEWFRNSPGGRQAGDIQWKVDRSTDPGRRTPGPTNGQRPGPRPPTTTPPALDRQPRPAVPRPGPEGGPPRSVPPRPPTPPRRPPGPTGAQQGQRPPGRPGTPPGAVGIAPRPAPPRPPQGVNGAPANGAKINGSPVNGVQQAYPAGPAPAPAPAQAAPAPAPAQAPAPAPAPTPAPAAPEPFSADSPPSRVASIVVTAAVVVIFTAVFETAIAPLVAGSVLLRIVLLSVTITLAIGVVRPPGLRQWLANMLIPVAVRKRMEGGRPPPR